MIDRLKGAAEQLQDEWDNDPRWEGVERTYRAEDVIRLRGSVQEEHTLARLGAERLWDLLHTEDYASGRTWRSPNPLFDDVWSIKAVGDRELR
ncbi:hypothetical protein AB0J64_52230, partial [Nonomuraea sp. NPDC049695]